MPSTAVEILRDVVRALRESKLFAMVWLGQAGSQTESPRALVEYEGHESFPADDDAERVWGRLRISITVHVRSASPAEGLLRAAELCDQAAGALMADPSRGGRCQDLPVGRATETGRTEVVSGASRPELEMSFSVRCHFESGEQRP